ncbi:MAG: hypothetical protein AABP62_09645 [Planctomycetota bacterium]
MIDSNSTRMPSDSEPDPTGQSGEVIDAGRGRIFPCERCGADLQFSIGEQSLQCPYCGAVKQIELREDAPIVERDYMTMLSRLKELREQGHDEDEQATNEHAIRCDSCGGEVIFQGTLTSTHCPYCASPLQRDKIHDAPSRIPVDGILPFLVPEQTAAQGLRDWIRSLWWAPNEFLRQGASGKFNGVYLPYFTYDALTFTRYAGQRGDYYYVTVGTGNNRRTERRIRWSFSDGEFQRFFDDELVIAAKHQSEALVRSLEPWPLDRCIPFTQHVLAGFFARTYDVPLEDGFNVARQRIESALTTDVRQRIGGDVQNVTSQQTNYSAITFKHLMLPVWLLAYRYREKTYRVMINAVTGEVSGERPYSAIKIICAVLCGLAIAFGLWALHSSRVQAAWKQTEPTVNVVDNSRPAFGGNSMLANEITRLDIER